MSEPVQLARVIQGELPFTLNLPEATYPVLVDGASYPIDVLQNRLAVADGPDMMRFGTADELRADFGDRWATSYKHDLRTIVRHRDQATVPRSELPAPTDGQLFEAAQSYLLRATPGVVPGGAEQLQIQARHWLAHLNHDDRGAFTTDTSVRLAAAAAFPHRDVAYFCGAVNVLIRLYMATFNDRFVQEITESMFSGTAMRGLHYAVFCNGKLFDSGHHAGGFFPFLIRRPWWEHPEQAVAAFRTQLETSPEPDPVALLHVRAQSMLLRGAYRSAMLEASAAFDLCLVRKIRAGLLAKGKTDLEIEQLLEDNQRYEDRAKGLLKQATGNSAPEVDNTRWERFRQDRRNRGSIAHSANEPNQIYATEAVENMIALTESIGRLPV
jgi:hypothetical protein